MMTIPRGRHRNVHPFPARMAPDLALQKIEDLTSPGDVVLDPMCGSGTVPRLAVEENRRAIACDLDPLAVLITRTACKPNWSKSLRERAQEVVQSARSLDDRRPDWIDADPKTSEFVDFWFAPQQRTALGQLARVLVARPSTDDPLRVALSRLIVTKDGGASLARDTSHSRPHRVRLTNGYDVFSGFLESAARIERLVSHTDAQQRASIRTVDARSLAFVQAGSVDLVVTSPPYLNAIDYLRGHRMSLVWLGWQVGDLRVLRGESIGTERALRPAREEVVAMAENGVPLIEDLPARERGMVWRFTHDIDRLCRSLSRVTKRGGHLVFVVADSQLKGVPVANSALCRLAAQRHGFELEEGILRPLPAQHRYLPPPNGGVGLNARMREEYVLTFEQRN